MVQNKLLNYVGLAQKANKIVSGTEAVLDAITKQQAHLVYLSNDVSEATLDKISGKCHYYQIPLVNKFNSEQLSHAIGKPGRKVLAVVDKEFSRVMMNEIERGDLYEG